MKKNTNLISSALILIIALTVGLSCSRFTDSTASQNTTTVNTVENKSTGTAPQTKPPKVEKADFTLTAEAYDLEFTKKGVKEADLQKYANKNIQVSGRVSLLSLEKKGTTQPWVTLFAPGVLHGVSCYFDDDNLGQMQQLKMDKIVTVQGLQGDFIVPEVSPRLEHCAVIKAE